MRNGSLVAVLAISAAAVSGCQTTNPDFDSAVGSATATGGGTTTFGGTGTGTTGTGTTGTGTPTGSPTGTSTGQVLGGGSSTFAFNDNGAATNNSTFTEVTISNAGGGLNTETASVAVDVTTSGMTWAAPITMPLFSNSVDGTLTAGGVPQMGGTYSEYREIDSDTDAELQIWEFNHSRVGQYAVWFDPSAPNNNNFAMFYDGDATPEAALPAATATYNGSFGGVAVASNWANFTRTINDPFATDIVAGDSWSPNGTWRVTGSSQIVADFGAGDITGSITNMTWRKYTAEDSSYDGYETIVPAEISPFHDYQMTGTIDGNTYTGSVGGPIGGVVTGDNALNGGFFGPNAEETAGVLRSFTTSPDPDDGISPYEENRRGFIDIRGIFQGTR